MIWVMDLGPEDMNKLNGSTKQPEFWRFMVMQQLYAVDNWTYSC